MRTRIGFLAVAMLAAVMVIGVVSAASGSSSGHLRTWGLQRGATPQKAAVPHIAGTTQLVVFTRNEHTRDVDEPPAGFSQGDESTTSSGLWNAAGQRVGRLDAAGTVTTVFRNAHTARLQFTFTSTLRGDQITATGVLIASDATQGFDAAITGGTGKYRGAKGEVHVQFLTGNSSRLTYQFMS
jgi:hypothetical protein